MKNSRKKSSAALWENRELGATESFARKATAKREKALDKKLGLQVISIRLQRNLIDELKDLAKESGIGYQPFIRQILTHYVRHEKRDRAKHLKIIGR